MNDLMTKSFLSYVELKKQAQKDVEADNLGTDCDTSRFNPTEEENLSLFFQEVEAIKTVMEEITSLLLDLQRLNEETKSTYSAKVIRGLRDQMDSNMVSVLRNAKDVKCRLEVLDQSGIPNCTIVRTRKSVINGLRVKLRDTMNDFQSLRDKILGDYKEDLKRRYFNTTGQNATEDVIEKMLNSGSGKVSIFDGNAAESDLRCRERHDAVIDIQRSLSKLHQVFLDMAVLVETQGEKIDDIEANVANAGSYISGGTNSLYYASQMKRQNKKWMFWVFAVMVIIFLVCLISTLTS